MSDETKKPEPAPVVGIRDEIYNAEMMLQDVSKFLKVDGIERGVFFGLDSTGCMRLWVASMHHRDLTYLAKKFELWLSAELNGEHR